MSERQDDPVLRALFAQARTLEPTNAEVGAVLQRLKPRRRRFHLTRVRLMIAIAILTLGGIAAARTLISPTVLAAHNVGCMAGTNLRASSSADISVGGQSALQGCAKALGVPADRLVACAGGGAYPRVLVFYASGREQCRRLGLSPLLATYAAAQARVAALAHAVDTEQASKYCFPPRLFVPRLQGLLDHLGWSGWRARLEHEPAGFADSPGGGSCAQIGLGGIPTGGASVPDVSGHLDTTRHLLQVDLGPPPSLSLLLEAITTPLDTASGRRCFTVAALRTYVAGVLARHQLQSAFAVTSEPRGEQFGQGRQVPYDQGCTILIGLLPAGENPTLIDVRLAQSSAPRPRAAMPPQSAYH